MESMNALFEQYGYFVLFFGLFAESLALPFPGELAMAISGHMATYGSFHLSVIVLCSYVGAIAGTTLTYYLGYKLGTPFFDRYGKYMFMNRERREKISGWFNKYGDKLILVSYFIPGLRHFTGYVSGMLKVKRSTFFIYNYIGGLAWVMLYVSLGHVFGRNIEQLLHLISRYAGMAAAVAAAALVIGLIVRHNRAAIVRKLWPRGRKALERK
ncbi:hypothetical protein PAESOLCIP111_01685 [Paenibacillus solanacearum]|uniref:VTT domain-containing protein n=1 Tax=Paenibacillus solanacearum TaxID=2048548 RepID=A0A916K035_9BACL|nr:DedA family protein [Paenibacillus solanacearum]CAG7614196.1 hypothetical protein PAESOLCIP111_01685 [Paenibacillus solanacearum]